MLALTFENAELKTTINISIVIFKVLMKIYIFS